MVSRGRIFDMSTKAKSPTAAAAKAIAVAALLAANAIYELRRDWNGKMRLGWWAGSEGVDYLAFDAVVALRLLRGE